MLYFLACWNIRLHFIPLILLQYTMKVDLGIKAVCFDICAFECQILCLDPENNGSQEILFLLKYALSKQNLRIGREDW